MQVRDEDAGDYEAVRAINESAFETGAEAGLVDMLREQARPVISLVAENDGDIIGHILFSPMSIAGHENQQLMGLAPLAVACGHQREGVGSALVRAGIEKCRESGVGAIIVLGHAEYYPRFGFVPASSFGIDSEYDVADEVFMLLELQDGYLRGKSGTARYHGAFSSV